MNPMRYREDIRPLSEFRANTAAFMEQIRTSRRPIVLTQHGRGAAVLISIDEYERMVERVAVLEDIRVAEQQIVEGAVVDHETALQTVRARLGL